MKRGGFFLIGAAIAAGLLRLSSPTPATAPSEKTEALGTAETKKKPAVDKPPSSAAEHPNETDIGKNISAFFGRPIELLDATSAKDADVDELVHHWDVPKD